MKKLIFLISLLTIYSCQTKSQNSFVIEIEEKLIDVTEYNPKKALKRDFSIRENLKNDTLIIDLDKNYRFINNNGVPHDENRVHYFLDSLSSKYSLIQIKEYESQHYLLIDRELNRIDTLPAYPFFSKNKKNIFLANFNPYEIYLEKNPPTEDIYIYIYKTN